MWEKLSKIQGAIVLAIFGTIVISLFIMVMVILAAKQSKWDLADKWLTMLFSSVLCNGFLGFLYVKSQGTKTNTP